MTGDHYFSQSPESELKIKNVTVDLAGAPRRVTTANGIFSPDRIDLGTRVLLGSTPPPPIGGHLLDLGCGWGPIALTLGLLSPDATVWAVDVNERALDLVRRNAASLGAENVHAVLPDDVPGDVRFSTIWSNPPIRVGKSELHNMLQRWIPRLVPGSDGYFVVQRNLGSDSLQRWLRAELHDEYSVARVATSKGYRVLRTRRHTGSTEPVDVVN
ncbi:class I SAM-dependent methyltransferase [Paramicrobacterium agarici]|uniref:class I SAM-dependent methyltransferase n=1 Tax=Paramicrobacterium agarici TaxID=630514 RepID=UPI00114E32B9|nr:methyltransferase [Microbacterium agarici]TQO24111.1 16S rRNA m(2)G 1207 methyltransferase [Microbacterium agarici]